MPDKKNGLAPTNTRRCMVNAGVWETLSIETCRWGIEDICAALAGICQEQYEEV